VKKGGIMESSSSSPETPKFSGMFLTKKIWKNNAKNFSNLLKIEKKNLRNEMTRLGQKIRNQKFNH